MRIGFLEKLPRVLQADACRVQRNQVVAVFSIMWEDLNTHLCSPL